MNTGTTHSCHEMVTKFSFFVVLNVLFSSNESST